MSIPLIKWGVAELRKLQAWGRRDRELLKYLAWVSEQRKQKQIREKHDKQD